MGTAALAALAIGGTAAAGGGMPLGVAAGLGAYYLFAPPTKERLGSGGRSIDSTKYSEAPSRSITDWTVDDFRGALAAADSGDLSLAADLCDALIWGDDRVTGVLRERILSVIGAPVSFEESRNATGVPALRALEASSDWWDMLPETEQVELLSWFHVLGVALGEKVWTETDANGVEIARIRNGRNVPRVRVWHPRCVRKDVRTGQYYVRLDGGVEIPIRQGDERWILLTAGGARPWAKGLWRALAPLVLLKWYARDDWAEQSEKYSKGVLALQGPEDADDELRKKLSRELYNLGNEGVIALPKGWDLKVVELKANSWETYQAQIGLSNTSISVTIIGTNLPTEVTAGAGTGATVQGTVRQDIKRADAEHLSTEYREWIGKDWARVNFRNPELAPWPRHLVEPPADTASLATTWKSASEALVLLIEKQAPVDVVAYMRVFKIPAVEGAVFKMPAPAAPVREAA